MSTHEVRDHALPVPSRRVFLGAALGGAAIVLTPTTFAAAATGSSVTKTITGHLDPGATDFVYLPVEVPKGVNRISVSTPTTDRSSRPGCSATPAISESSTRKGSTSAGAASADGPPGSAPSSRSARRTAETDTCTPYIRTAAGPRTRSRPARAAGLDFVVSTDHNTSSSHAVWGPLADPYLLTTTDR